MRDYIYSEPVPKLSYCNQMIAITTVSLKLKLDEIILHAGYMSHCDTFQCFNNHLSTMLNRQLVLHEKCTVTADLILIYFLTKVI